MSEKNPVIVPKPVFRGILAVRDSGLTNMFDVPVVQQIARRAVRTGSRVIRTKARRAGAPCPHLHRASRPQ